MSAEPTYLEFLESFNQDLAGLGCGARVAVVTGSSEEMEIIDRDRAQIGRIPIRIDPDVFLAFMLIVESSFSEGQRRAGSSAPAH